MKQHTFKQGSSFAYNARYKPAGDAPADLTDVAIASEVRDPQRGLVATLRVVKAADNMSFRLEAPAGTAGWPLKTLNCDIKLSYGGVTGYTETFSFNVVQAVTA